MSRSVSSSLAAKSESILVGEGGRDALVELGDDEDMEAVLVVLAVEVVEEIESLLRGRGGLAEGGEYWRRVRREALMNIKAHTVSGRLFVFG